MKLFDKNTNKISNEQSSNSLLALDVGTTCVKALVFKIENGNIVVLGYGKASQQGEAMKGAMIVNLTSVIETCDLAVGDAVKDMTTNLPSKVILGIAGELVRGVPIMAKYEREDPDEKINQKEIEKVFEKIKKNAFTDVKNEIADETGLLPDQIEELNSTVNDTYIDGFRVVNPLNYQGKDVSFRVFSTFAPQIHVNSLKSIASALGFEIIDIIVEPYAVSRALKGSTSEKFSGVFIDIGGGTTDIAVVEKGGILGTKMFAFGGKVFTKRLEKFLKTDFNSAEEYKLKYSEKELSDKQTTELDELFEKDASIWVEGVRYALSEFEDMEVCPSKFYLCGGGALLPQIKKVLMEYPWLQVLKFEKFPDIEFITPDMLKNIVDPNSYLTNIKDIAPTALAYIASEK